MPIYPCKKSHYHITLPGNQGFSLMEVMITLAIISIVVSIATVNLSGSLQGARFASQSKAAAREIVNYRAKALLLGQSAAIVTDTSFPLPDNISNIWRLPLPDGWNIQGNAIMISPSGMCLGGHIRLIGPHGRKADYDFAPPNCTPERIAASVGK